jgi:probable tail fiber protein|nr:MAG TPA: tail collar fiber protein [Caudoviricetes sp.]
MTSQYFAILTDYGTRAIAHALSQGQPLQLAKFAVGDGNGQAVTPTASATALVHQTHIAPVSAVSLDPRNNKQVIVELTIPENIGGFYIREMGVFDSQNKLIAYANCPESFKPTESSGSGKVQVLRMILKVESSSAVTLSIDNSVIFVTRQQMTPKTITATTQNGFDESGHCHEIATASTSQQGITQLYSGYESESEDMAATPKSIKLLKAFIDALTRNLSNYIPNSKKSSAVNSNSADTVATSAAVKTAYDKGVNAEKAADDANNNANGRVPKTGDTTINGTLRAKNTSGGWSAYQFETLQGFWQLEVHPNSHEAANRRFNMMFIPNIGNSVYLSFPALGNNGEVVAYQSWAVNKAGDSMTGILRTVGIASTHFGDGAYSNQYTSGAPFMVEATGSKDRDTYHPFVKGLVRSKGRYGAGFSFGYTTKQGAGDGFGRGIIHLIEDNGANRLWAFEHNGDFNSAGDVRSSSGKSLNNSVQTSDYRSQWGQTGWVKLPNGLILQWGKTPVIHDENSTDIVFPIAFPNKVLNIQLTENQMRTVHNHATHLAALNVTNSKFTFKINSTLPIDSSADWFAIGY